MVKIVKKKVDDFGNHQLQYFYRVVNDYQKTKSYYIPQNKYILQNIPYLYVNTKQWF